MNPPLSDFVARIQRAYPDLAIADARFHAAGQFSDVLIVNHALIFRFPKSPHVASELYREVPVLRALQGRLPLSIPNPIYMAESADGLSFMGYPMLPGRPLLRDLFATLQDASVLQQIAAELAGFLKALHSLQPGALGLHFEPADPLVEWGQLYADFRDKLFPHMRPDACQQVSASFDAALNDSSLWNFQPVLCHGDFGTGNILYADGHITGIIDFSFCGLGDPAQEVGALLASYGEAFVQRVFEFYPELRPVWPRARFIRGNYALMQALYALRDNSPDDFADGMRDYV